MTLENLLNTLIEKGWKPFGDEHIHGAIKAMYYVRFLRGRENSDREIYLRQIVSKESGLWQFVCENGMVKVGDHLDYWDKNYSRPDNYSELNCDATEYEYRLIEASLQDERKLERFLLDNIKVEGN